MEDQSKVKSAAIKTKIRQAAKSLDSSFGYPLALLRKNPLESLGVVIIFGLLYNKFSKPSQKLLELIVKR